jgi:hypothetical protein
MGITSTSETGFSTTVLEESARDRKDQLEEMILKLKKIEVQLSLMTDEEIDEYDAWGS